VILDRDREFLFIHIPKTGGSAVCSAVRDQVTNGIVSRDNEKHKHYGATEVIEEYPEFDPSTWTVAAVIRNPWTMIASDYNFHLSHSRRIRGAGPRTDPLTCWRRQVRRLASLPFDAFVMEEHICKNPTTRWSRFTSDCSGVCVVNRVLRFENLERDSLELLRELGYVMDSLPVDNATDYTESAEELYRKYPSAADWIAEFYADEIEEFGYERPGVE